MNLSLFPPRGTNPNPFVPPPFNLFPHPPALFFVIWFVFLAYLYLSWQGPFSFIQKPPPLITSTFPLPPRAAAKRSILYPSSTPPSTPPFRGGAVHVRAINDRSIQFFKEVPSRPSSLVPQRFDHNLVLVSPLTCQHPLLHETFPLLQNDPLPILFHSAVLFLSEVFSVIFFPLFFPILGLVRPFLLFLFPQRPGS